VWSRWCLRRRRRQRKSRLRREPKGSRAVSPRPRPAPVPGWASPASPPPGLRVAPGSRPAPPVVLESYFLSRRSSPDPVREKNHNQGRAIQRLVEPVDQCGASQKEGYLRPNRPHCQYRTRGRALPTTGVDPDRSAGPVGFGDGQRSPGDGASPRRPRAAVRIDTHRLDVFDPGRSDSSFASLERNARVDCRAATLPPARLADCEGGQRPDDCRAASDSKAAWRTWRFGSLSRSARTRSR